MVSQAKMATSCPCLSRMAMMPLVRMSSPGVVRPNTRQSTITKVMGVKVFMLK